MSRRSFLQGSIAAMSVSSLLGDLKSAIAAEGAGASPLGYTVTEIAGSAGLNFQHISGGDTRKKYILETTGSGVAWFDYDNDGWPDLFLVNGARLEGLAGETRPTNKLFHNNRNGTFTDVTAKARLGNAGWGQGVCIGDFDNDGFDDLFVTYWGENLLFHNNGDGTFTEVGKKAAVAGPATRWSTGCAFVDFDRDGWLDLVVTHYVDFALQTAQDPGSNPYCTYRKLPVMCGPRGLKPDHCSLYRNNRDGTFTDVTERSGMGKTPLFGMGVLVADFDNDGWPDLYVASDSTASVLYMNNHDGTFREEALLRGVAYSAEGAEQAGMGVAAGDYDGDGSLDILKTNFSDESPNLYKNEGKASFTDVGAEAGVNRQTHFVGWGCGFFDPDNDGLLDIFYTNGHVYPELESVQVDTRFREPCTLYRNRGNGQFQEVTALAGPALTTAATGRGCAFADFNNDGTVDAVINNQGAQPSLLRFTASNTNNWITIKLVGKESNRSAIGARVRCIAGPLSLIDEVRSGGSYLSQNDLRLHFGLRDRKKADLLEVRWPNGHVDQLHDVMADQFVRIEEGGHLTVLRRPA